MIIVNIAIVSILIGLYINTPPLKPFDIYGNSKEFKKEFNNEIGKMRYKSLNIM